MFAIIVCFILSFCLEGFAFNWTGYWSSGINSVNYPQYDLPLDPVFFNQTGEMVLLEILYIVDTCMNVTLPQSGYYNFPDANSSFSILYLSSDSIQLDGGWDGSDNFDYNFKPTEGGTRFYRNSLKPWNWTGTFSLQGTCSFASWTPPQEITCSPSNAQNTSYHCVWKDFNSFNFIPLDVVCLTEGYGCAYVTPDETGNVLNLRDNPYSQSSENSCFYSRSNYALDLKSPYVFIVFFMIAFLSL